MVLSVFQPAFHTVTGHGSGGVRYKPLHAIDLCGNTKSRAHIHIRGNRGPERNLTCFGLHCGVSPFRRLFAKPLQMCFQAHWIKFRPAGNIQFPNIEPACNADNPIVFAERKAILPFEVF